ncbi:hypothetical protein [Paenibacillus glucanolyticus]|uniref:hypothetical protein n=1 Tax=Paenibacillus glucanolyticus TaxID=59843 RepID=UPI0030EF7827
MLKIDLNGLISTVAASTAAIVAIVSGLLFSRLLSLSSEKNGILRRLNELKADIDLRREQFLEISDWLLWDDAKDFINEHAYEIIMKHI